MGNNTRKRDNESLIEEARTKIDETVKIIDSMKSGEITQETSDINNISIGISSESGFLNISGKFETYNGLNNQWEGVYGATVEIYDYDNLSFDDLLGTFVIENTDGSFSSVVSNSDEEGGGQEVYLKFIADDENVNVRPPLNPFNYHTQTSVMPEALDNSTLIFNVQSNMTDNNSGAWHVLREIYRGVNYENIKGYVGKVTVV